MVQLFDSWAHHLSPTQFAEFSLPYAEQIIRDVHAKHPDVPLIFHANGGDPLIDLDAKKELTADHVMLAVASHLLPTTCVIRE